MGISYQCLDNDDGLEDYGEKNLWPLHFPAGRPDDDDEDEVNDGLSHFLATLVREELTTEICSVHHSSRSISYFALIICTSMITELQNFNIVFIRRKYTPCSFLHPERF